MKAFLIGLIFLFAVGVMAGIGVLFFPLFLVMGFFLKIIIAVSFVILSIWLLGKLIIFVWEAIFRVRK